MPEPPVAAGDTEEDVEQPQHEGDGRDIEQERMHRGRRQPTGPPVVASTTRKPIIRMPIVLCRRPPMVMAL